MVDHQPACARRYDTEGRPLNGSKKAYSAGNGTSLPHFFKLEACLSLIFHCILLLQPSLIGLWTLACYYSSSPLHGKLGVSFRGFFLLDWSSLTLVLESYSHQISVIQSLPLRLEKPGGFNGDEKRQPIIWNRQKSPLHLFLLSARNDGNGVSLAGFLW